MLLRNTFVVLLLLLVFPDSARPQAPPPTPWGSFINVLSGIRNGTFNRFGNAPGLEPKAPLKAIGDPANLEKGVPKIVQQAAKVKIQEDQKRQKIKAIKYLATYGCGCYDRGDVEVKEDGTSTEVKPTSEAFITALQDCTEEVRFAAVRYITWSAESAPCAKCGGRSCCNEDIVKQLAKMAWDIDEHGCPVESSERVREAAEVAVRTCCPSPEPVSVLERKPDENIEGPRTDELEHEGKSDVDAKSPPSAVEKTKTTGSGLSLIKLPPLPSFLARRDATAREQRAPGPSDSVSTGKVHARVE